jgi:hypothetical protein
MATTLVQDLRNLGVTAYRFGPRDQLPVGSWLLQGTFVQVDEGNRLERAMIGFGQGATELDVVASLSDLHGEGPRPFCEVSTIAHSRRSAGAIMSLNPFDARRPFHARRFGLGQKRHGNWFEARDHHRSSRRLPRLRIRFLILHARAGRPSSRLRPPKLGCRSV